MPDINPNLYCTARIVVLNKVDKEEQVELFNRENLKDQNVEIRVMGYFGYESIKKYRMLSSYRKIFIERLNISSDNAQQLTNTIELVRRSQTGALVRYPSVSFEEINREEILKIKYTHLPHTKIVFSLYSEFLL